MMKAGGKSCGLSWTIVISIEVEMKNTCRWPAGTDASWDSCQIERPGIENYSSSILSGIDFMMRAPDMHERFDTLGDGIPLTMF